MAVGLKKMGKPSPVKVWQVAAVQAGIALYGYYSGKKKRDREAREAKRATEASRAAYMQQEYANPYANLENPYEDLTINQQQAQFQAQQGAQQRANILGGLRGTAGGAGVAGLAQAMANQSTLDTQRISASIGQQEAMNQRLRAQGAAKGQQLEAYGEQAVSLREQQRLETLYGIDMARSTAANQAKQQAKANLYSGLGQAAGSLAGGMGGGTTAKMGGTNPGGTTAKMGGTTPGGMGGDTTAKMGGVGSPDISLQTGSIQGLNYVPPQTNTFPLGQSYEDWETSNWLKQSRKVWDRMGY